MAVAELKAVIFDVDGTLADTERDGHRLAFNLAFADAGLDWQWSETLYEDLLSITGGKERIHYYLHHYPSNFKHPEDLQGFIADLHHNKTKHYVNLLENGAIALRTGVKRLFNEARTQGLRLAIATTTTAKNVEVLLTQTLGRESLQWFEVIAAGDCVATKKPAADIYHYVLHEMGLAATQCLALEDSHCGLLSALAADLATVITVNRYTQSQDFTGAAIVLSHMGEPDHPFQVLSGNISGFDYLNVAMLQLLFANFHAR